MADEMWGVLRDNNLGVLATCVEDKPYCSLMTYVVDPEREHRVYLVMQSGTRKFENMIGNPNISLLVDNRRERDRSHEADITALTVLGRARVVRDPAARVRIIEIMAGRHPHLREVTHQPDTEVVEIQAQAYLLLHGPTDARFVVVAQ